MRAIIIGGGIGGLTGAVALRKKGIDAEVYEKSPELREVGAGISLWPNAVKALRKLGLGDALDAISLVNQDGAVRRWNGTILSRTPTRELERRFGGGVIVLHRSELLNVLAQGVGAANIHLGHVCTSIDQDSDGVTATFANGATARGDVLIGADGLHSVVRAWLGHNAPLRYSGYTAWRAIVPFDTSSVVPGETWGRGCRFGLLPVKGNRVYWFATSNAPEGEHDSSAGPKARLLSLFKGWHEPIEALIRAGDDSTILRNDIYDRDTLAAWGRGRVTLLGDAAHPMTPNLGQGGCQAIEDAMQLAACLAVERNVETALKNYESRRIKRTDSIVSASRRLGAMSQIDSPIVCGLRDLMMRLTPNSVTLRTLAPVVGYEGHLAD
ncbi:MAG TPA: FAD-dependent monooxygenase [Bryobacteraceae bacterium]|nr:FAD-dependent monooxygenase [Bryobacteraceae bacterium]